MALKLCYPLVTPPSKGKFKLETKAIVCEYIPSLIFEKPSTKPFFSRVAEAIRLVFSSRSASWVPASGLDEQTIRDLRILATVDALTENLSPALRDSLASSALAAAKRLELPAESEVSAAA